MDDKIDKNQFVKYLQEHKGIIFKICNSYCYNTTEREDLAQEIIYQLWKSFPTYHPEFRFTTWMYRVALNVAISFYRKNRNVNTKVELIENHTDIEDPYESDVDLDHEHERNRMLLHQFIRELKELDRALMILYLESKSYKEISEILGISETNVGTRMNRIKERLKQKFVTLNL
jgi:RNA polymerase sigma-70 factor (ECF subfamily)